MLKVHDPTGIGMGKTGEKNITFSFASKKTEGMYLQVTKFVSCRDFHNEVLRCAILDDGTAFSTGYYPGKVKFDTSRTRILIANTSGSEDIFNRLRCAVKVLNRYCKIAGVSKFKLYRTTYTSSKYDYSVIEDFKIFKDSCFLLIGSSEWVRVPQLVSFISLILRLVLMSGPSYFSDKVSLTNSWKSVIHDVSLPTEGKYKILREKGNYLSSNYRDFLMHSYRFFEPILKARKKIFPRVEDIKHYYPRQNPKSYGSFGSWTGFYYLCRGNIYQKGIKEAVSPILERSR